MIQQLDRYHEMNIEQIISEKNKGEAILSSIEDGLVVFDKMLRVTGINPAARQLLNLGFAESSTLQCMDILQEPHFCDLIRRTLETGAQPNVPDEQRIIVLPDRDGDRFLLVFRYDYSRKGPESFRHRAPAQGCHPPEGSGAAQE